MHPDQRALLDTILAYPSEDTPRLVYADWLEENGASERAEMIRRQVRYAILHCELWDGVHCDHWNGQLGEGRVQAWCPTCLEINAIKTTYIDCAIETGGVPFAVREQDRSTSEPTLREITSLPAFDNTMGTGGSIIPATGKQCTPIYRRGFVDEVSCTMGCWMQFGHEIMRWHPVRRVNVTDKSPWESAPNDDEHYGWWQDHQRGPVDFCEIPKPIMLLMENDPRRIKASFDYNIHMDSHGIVAFASQTDAVDALSDACIQFGKGK